MNTVFVGKQSLTLGGLGETTSHSTLHQIFIPFGPIKSIDIPKNPAKPGRSKGHAFIEYEEGDDCEHAIFNMNDSVIEGKVVKVSLAKEEKIKQNSSKPVWMDQDWHQQNAQQYEQNQENQ